MFEKEVSILYVKPYNFTNDKTGEVLQGCKVAYFMTVPINTKDEKGYRVDYANLSYDYADKLLKVTLPYKSVGKFNTNSKNVLKLVDIVVK